MMANEAVFPRELKDLSFEIFYNQLLLKANHSSIVDFVRDDFETMEITLK